VLNLEGAFELDAAISDGTETGGVAGVTVRHPVCLARRVMEGTPHLLMAGAGAMALAEGLEHLRATTDAQLQRWEEARRAGSLTPDRYGSAEHVDTVGAVALDDSGRLAAATSTGGVFGKLPGRIGDSPLLGAGFFVNEAAAVVGTGVGEIFIETLACYQTALLIGEGIAPQEACNEVIGRVGRHSPLSAGLLALDVQGRTGCAFRGAVLPAASHLGILEARRFV
jgi:L-asparaginase / beta-aspartyl-peptidase